MFIIQDLSQSIFVLIIGSIAFNFLYNSVRRYYRNNTDINLCDRPWWVHLFGLQRDVHRLLLDAQLYHGQELHPAGMVMRIAYHVLLVVLVLSK